MTRTGFSQRVVLGSLFAVMIVMTGGSASALAAIEGPGWELTAQTYPTYLPPAGRGTVDIDVFNVGAGASHGTITVTDDLPSGVTAIEAGELRAVNNGVSPSIGHQRWLCTGNGPEGGVDGASVVTCTNSPVSEEGLPEFDGGGGTPSSKGPNRQTRVGILVQAAGEASGLVNHATIAGGEAPTPASTVDPITISSHVPPFGFVGWDGWLSNANGTLDSRAGSHPYEATFTFDLADALNEEQEGHPAGGSPRDIEVELPPGLIGDPAALPECTRAELDQEACPAGSMIGVDTAYFSGATVQETGFQVFNMVPPPGVPSELGFSFDDILTFLDSNVRSGSDYGVTTQLDQVPQRDIVSNVLTIWNVPGEASHNLWRKGEVGGCSAEEIEHAGAGSEAGKDACTAPQNPILKPFLTVPTQCGVPEPVIIRADTWQNPSVTSEDEFELHNSDDVPTSFSGCEKLQFGPSIQSAPETSEVETPSGLDFEVKPPLGGLEEQEELTTADIKDTSVTLPEGFVINPGQAAGLQACPLSADGITTEAEKAEGREDDGPANCPPASKVGTVKIQTPLLEGAPEKELEGNVYVLQSEPPEIKLLIAASADGVNVKLEGTVHLNEQTGQLDTIFDDSPQLPFSDFKLSFNGGTRAALDTPAACGTYTTTANFESWASPLVAAFPTGAMSGIDAGLGGGPCPSLPLPFAPTLSAGSTSDQAGAFTGFSLLLQRADGQQHLSSFTTTLPPGLTGAISKVPPCQEPEAALGNCPASSQIGHAIVSSGPGNFPLVVPQPGDPEAPIYLTGPYKNAPFGLTTVVPVIAGPFNLGIEIVRSTIAVDPRTAQVTVTTNPLPQIIKGVPTDLRTIEAVIERPNVEFTLNPTNCDPLSFTGAATSTQGATSSLGSSFRVGSCQSLKFTPSLAVSTAGHASKADGTSLNVKVSYPRGALGAQSWFRETKFDFPKQLPARLETLQKACLEHVFETDPAACPAPSLVGHATVHTQVLPVPLTGPVYLVSYGAAKFPEAVFVLQGDNVTIDLHGETFVNNKTGITSATFRNTPDVPFESIEVDLPAGPYSEFGTFLPMKDRYDMCGQSLKMPTFLAAQNGLEIHETTKISITGCKKAKKKSKHPKKARRKAKRKK